MAVALIRLSTTNKRENDKLSKLYAYIFQTKDYLLHAEALRRHFREINTRLDAFDEEKLRFIQESLLRKSVALAAATTIYAQKGMEHLREKVFRNVALQIEDRNLVKEILRAKYGEDAERYDIDLYEEDLEPLIAVLASLENSKNGLQDN